MFRPLQGHHQAIYSKQVFKILLTLLGSHQCLHIIGRSLRYITLHFRFTTLRRRNVITLHYITF